MDGKRDQARDGLEGLVASEHGRLVETSRSPHRIERYAGAIESRDLFEAWLKLTGELKEPTYEVVLKWKGLVSRVEESVRKALRERGAPLEATKALAQAEANLAHSVYLGSWSEQRSSARAMVAANATLAARTQLRSGTTGLASGDWRIIQRALHHDEALVDYVRYRDQYDAWVLQRENAPVRVSLGPATDIDAAATKFKAWSTSWTGSTKRGLTLTQDTRDAPAESGASLRRLVWEPVRAKLGQGISRVYVSPDGALAAVPLAALPGDEPGTILWDEMEFSWVASAWDLTRDAPATDAPARNLLVAPVHYSWSYFPSLPGAQKEVQGVAALLGASVGQVLLGAQANELQVRRLVRGSRIVHFATHAWTAGPLKLGPAERQDRAADAGTPTPDHRASTSLDEESVDSYLVGLDPMLGTGMVLGGLRNTKDGMGDGILTGLEISGLPLDGVELVVISGCDTAGTVRDGVGLIGLVQAVREAGAYSVLASLHAVLDEPTAELMNTFYRVALESRMNYPAALRRAALDLRKKGSAPVDWTGFVLYGAAR